MPKATLVDNDPGAGSGAPGDLDVTALVPALKMDAPNSTMLVLSSSVSDQSDTAAALDPIQ